VSSLYGQGELDCRGFRDLCIEAGLDDILLYVGGNLVVGKQPWDDVERRFTSTWGSTARFRPARASSRRSPAVRRFRGA
jgi:methylaspartate mutase S subunit